jgi:hypothetical protein
VKEKAELHAGYQCGCGATLSEAITKTAASTTKGRECI